MNNNDNKEQIEYLSNSFSLYSSRICNNMEDGRIIKTHQRIKNQSNTNNFMFCNNSILYMNIFLF